MEYVFLLIVGMFVSLSLIAFVINGCCVFAEKTRKSHIQVVDGIHVNGVYAFNPVDDGSKRVAYHNVIVKSCKNGIVRYKMFGSHVVDSDSVEVFKMLYMLSDDF